MAENSKIEWTDHTFNPWTGCKKVSPGCDHCYAEGWAKRSGHVQWGDTPRARTSEANWKLPLKWNAQAEREGRRFRVFCASLADVFDNAVPAEWRRDLFNLILSTPSLDWLLLTKRIGNAARMIEETLPEGMKALPADHPIAWPWPNVWIGATVVNQEEADRDIPKLLATPAHVRFLSMEPLLGPVDLTGLWSTQTGRKAIAGPIPHDYYSFINWVIVGGESGPGARPMHPDWARSLRDQCEKAGVPFLFKQWGEWRPISDMENADYDRLYRSRVKAREGEDQGALDESYGRDCTVPTGIVHTDGSLHDVLEPMAFRQGTGAMQTFRVGKKAAGRLLDGRTHDEFPGIVEAPRGGEQ